MKCTVDVPSVKCNAVVYIVEIKRCYTEKLFLIFNQLSWLCKRKVSLSALITEAQLMQLQMAVWCWVSR